MQHVSDLKQENLFFLQYFSFYEQLKFHYFMLFWVEHEKVLYHLSWYFRNMSDPRLISCLGVLLGIDLMQMEDPGKGPTSESSTTSEPSDKPKPQTTSQPKSSSTSKSSSKQDNDISGEKQQVE